MLPAAIPGQSAESTTIDSLAIHLRDGEDIIRSAAARVFGTFENQAAAPALVEALLDEDPDVRTDAMASLVRCARPQDADAIRRSLMGDPERDVKMSAILALANLADKASVPLLRSLVKSRCSDDVAWEDETGMWDEWLDIQTAAISALGAMQCDEAIEDLLEVRGDEFGQDLDLVVFSTLALISERGIGILLDLMQDPNARVRRRVLQALEQARPDLLVSRVDQLVQDSSPDVRQLAIKCMDPIHPNVQVLALEDLDKNVRRAALAAFGAMRPELAQAALNDADEDVRITALEVLFEQRAPNADDDLVVNMSLWMKAAGPNLMTVCADLYGRVSGPMDCDPLTQLALDKDRPLEPRIAALRSLGRIESEAALDVLRTAIIDPLRQIRMAALAAIAERATSQTDVDRSVATAVLAAAMQGQMLSPDDEAATQPGGPFQADGSSVAMSKTEGDRSPRIRISPDGEIISNTEDEVTEVAVTGSAKSFPKSTLDAIQVISQNPNEDVSNEDDDTAESSAQPGLESGPASEDEFVDIPPEAADFNKKSRRRRVSVDGPDNFAADIQLVATIMAGTCPGSEVEAALAVVATSNDAELRTVAFEAIAKRAETLPISAELLLQLTTALAQEDPVIRGHAARAIAGSDADVSREVLSPYLDDPDPIVRSIALQSVVALRPEKANRGLRDESAIVRRAALEGLLGHGDGNDLERGLRICLEHNRIDSLSEACRSDGTAFGRLVDILEDHTLNGSQSLSRNQLQTLLEALASAKAPGAGERILA